MVQDEDWAGRMEQLTTFLGYGTIPSLLVRLAKIIACMRALWPITYFRDVMDLALHEAGSTRFGIRMRVPNSRDEIPLESKRSHMK